MSETPPLLPDAIRAVLPRLYSTEREADPVAHVKLFTPWAGWTWYITEFDGEDTLFGLVSGHEVELGYVSLAELEALRGPSGLRVERDRHFEPTRLSQVRRELDGLRERPRPEGREGPPAYRAPGRPVAPEKEPAIRMIETELSEGWAQASSPRCRGQKRRRGLFRR